MSVTYDIIMETRMTEMKDKIYGNSELFCRNDEVISISWG